MKQGSDAIRLRRHNQQELIAHQYLKSDMYETIIHLIQHIGPIRSCMRPRELHTALRKPLCRKEGGADLGLFRASCLRHLHVKREVRDGRGGRGEVESHELVTIYKWTIYNLQLMDVAIAEAGEDVLIGIDATITQEGPPTTHLLRTLQVDIYHQHLRIGGGSFS